LGDMGAQAGSLQPGMFPATPSTDVIKPVSSITAPANGASRAAESQVTISGTASDSGGVVSAVEVSVDGGTSWHRATGLQNWTYTWRPGALGVTNILSRAVDDSGNIEGNKPPIAITITPAVCPCTIWDVNAQPWLLDSNDANPIEVGLKFRTDTNGFISGIRF